MRENRVSSLRKKIVAFLVAPLSIIPLALVLGIYSCFIYYVKFSYESFLSEVYFIMRVMISGSFIGVIFAYVGLLCIGMPLYWILRRYKLLTLQRLLFLASVIGLIIAKWLLGNYYKIYIFYTIILVISSMTVAYAYWFLMRK